MSDHDIIALSLRAAREQLDNATEHYQHGELAMAGQDAHSALDDLRMAVRRIDEQRKEERRREREAKRREKANQRPWRDSDGYNGR